MADSSNIAPGLINDIADRQKKTRSYLTGFFQISSRLSGYHYFLKLLDCIAFDLPNSLGRYAVVVGKLV